MKNKPIIIVAGEPKSIFFEIFFKSLKKKILKSPLILICSLSILQRQMKLLNFKKKIKLINIKEINEVKFDIYAINLINVELNQNRKFKNDMLIRKYIKKCFDISFFLIKNKIASKLINGPIKKSSFLNRKYLGMTEYISSNFNSNNTGMLIYNKSLSVCPLTTHLPLKLVSKKITKKLIMDKLKLINKFYKKIFKFYPKIGVTGLNPHCESILKHNEDLKIINPTIQLAKKNGIFVSGPYAADTIFLKQNRKKFDVILGMYHDQVLTPLKTLYEYNAINVTMGLPFLRVSPDHGPNEKMVNKNLSNPISLYKALEFLDKN